MLKHLVLPFLLFLNLGAARAQDHVDCSAMQSQLLHATVHYCVLLPASYDVAAKGKNTAKYPVLYFLHGLGQNEQALFQSGGWNLVQDLREKHEIGDFLIVTPEARQSFYINSANGKVLYSDFFLEEFIPFIESKYRVQRGRATRAIAGVSMGGYGAFRFAFAHPEMFSAVSAESAAFMTDTPQELDNAMQSGTQLGRVMGPAFGNPIVVSHWDANNPLLLARKNQAKIRGLAIYFNCGDADDFGFEKGAEQMDKELTAEGIRHEFHLYPGSHDAEYFLSHLGEVMKFHWRVFASAH